MPADGVEKLCESCNKTVSRYKCPRCCARSCSVICVKQHKKTHNCNGQREKTSFVNLSEFNEGNVVSDLSFLEDTGRAIRASASTSGTPVTNLRCSFHVLDKLRRAARRRRIRLILSPFLSTRRKRNSTFCSSHRSNNMVWHIQWVFHTIRCEVKRCDENKTIKQLLQSLLSASVDHNRSECDNFKQVFLDHCEKLCTTPNTFAVLMEAENQPKKAFYVLDKKLSLRENLSMKTVVEYPVFHLVESAKLSDYLIKATNDDAIE